MDRPFARPEFPFTDRAEYLRALVRLVRRAPPLVDAGPIAYCDDGRSIVGLPAEVARLRCASCVLLSVYGATLAHQRGQRVDLCISELRSDIEHAWHREDGRRRDLSAEGGLVVPPSTYRGAVIVPVGMR